MDRLHMRGEELAVAAPARPSGRDGLTTAAAAAVAAAGRCWSYAGAAFQHVPRADSLHGHV